MRKLEHVSSKLWWKANVNAKSITMIETALEKLEPILADQQDE
jgi:hypothetical protein